ncbi:hypothetical protein COL60_07485 [Bacillus pseudomycoides]|uniref:Uncharacterized protein n=1 Tax=Bacillus pseudomycoides TaxID=64104 RepID=A0A2B5H950_9BACI|nr:hypothetical protein [Bacillus pseudomycoides]PDY46671.1 hypothetical protein CON79_13090 [Bacillus pseudomycoides]PEA83051.1 hypothetical protein CON99_13165 [Bacillus pseudomycoides]PED70034.1 hypothetical protein CON97_21315 [Bacillus pseudomycoides]PEE39458.1 hypothetical protein COO02_19080 [Bacillus pseudomycoides]PEI46640.1 hypothetical protein CN620_00790 [Bacillus pseudomycoides]
MQLRTKLFISMLSSVFLIIGSIIFFLNHHPMKWLWVFIAVSSIAQNLVIYRKYKRVH